MTNRHFLISFISLMIVSCAHAEKVVIDFNYEGDHRVDFSALKGSLKIAEFADERNIDDATLITETNFGENSGGYYAEVAIAKLVQTALEQGFESGGATLSEGETVFTISGALLAIDAIKVDRQGVENIQITFRTKVELTSQGRVVWQTTLFGRGRAPVEEGVIPVIQEALSRTIRELVGDDYFKMELIQTYSHSFN